MADRISPELREIVDLFPDGLIDISNIERTRETVRLRLAASPVRTDAFPGVAIRDETVAGLGSRPPLRIRLYLPEGRPTPSGALLFIHGGGYVMGELSQFDVHCSEVAQGAGCLVASIDYRLAPENPYPEPLEDCYAGLAYLAAASRRLGIDPGRVAVGGASAGGGLAAGLTLLARDRGGPPIAFQVLEAPMLDHRGITHSSHNVDHPKVWNRTANELAWRAYLGEAADGPVSEYASPALAADLAGLPPAYLSVSALELFLDEVIDYARRLMEAAVAVELHVYPNGFHGSAWAVPNASLSQRWRVDSINALRAVCGNANTNPASASRGTGA
jgi:acetyl esterase/lipase